MASDSGIPSLSTTASVTINVERHERNTDSLELGFSLENYYVRVYEELTINTTIRELNVINQATDKNVVCEIIEGNDEGHFAVISTNFKKDCAIVNRNELDRETTSRYNLTVSVKEISKKRAASYAITYVIIDVLDLNDEAPQWVFPDPQPYPSPSTTSGKYFTALSKTADASTFIIQVLAVDRDEGNFGRVQYQKKTESGQSNSFFHIDPTNGMIRNVAEFASSDNNTQRFHIVAYDNPGNGTDKHKTEGEVIINLISDEHRFVLMVDESSDEAYEHRDVILRSLQEETGMIPIIEKIQAKRTQDNGRTTVDTEKTDVWFVLTNVTDYSLVGRDSNVVQTIIESKLKLIEQSMAKKGVFIDGIRGPYDEPNTGMIVMKTYENYSWGPWAALIALACLIILFCIIGIIVLCISWARYQRALKRYHHSERTVMVVPTYEPEYAIAPPSYQKEFETQSLAMYVPEEPIVDLGEVNMTLTTHEGVLSGEATRKDMVIESAPGVVSGHGGRPGDDGTARMTVMNSSTLRSDIDHGDAVNAHVNPIYESNEMTTTKTYYTFTEDHRGEAYESQT
ncbi:unnamed protein product [Owenia fusiformis]|uniref:Cadherin domain-containing protein n=1 Tax=Owenia fusiformis TaxID=6347 RepID=A0A8S4PUF3_OWEFU|nr:unnamed protein product [Owenia fusiformis]